MRRADLEHVVAAAAQIVGEHEFVIVGSQAILGSYPDAPPSLLRSQEADGIRAMRLRRRSRSKAPSAMARTSIRRTATRRTR